MNESHELVYYFDVSEFREYWDSSNLFEAYMDHFEDDIALATAMVLWTLSIREISEWDMKSQ